MTDHNHDATTTGDDQGQAAPSVATILEVAAQTMPRVETMTAPEVRAALALLPARPGPDVGSVEDLQLTDDVTGRLYRPTSGNDGPLLVYFHGGGFTIGSVEGYDGSTRRLCERLDLPVLSVEYRLAPEHPFPVPVDDTWAALRWAADSQLGARGLVIGGDSAGGNLAAVAAIHARDEGIPVLHQLVIYPCVDPGCSAASHRAAEQSSPVLYTAGMAWYWRNYLGDSVSDTSVASDWRVDPRRADDLSGLAPATVVVAGIDPLHDEGIEYAELLRSAGVPVSTLRYPELFHGFMGFPDVLPDAKVAFDEVVAAVASGLATATAGDSTS